MEIETATVARRYRLMEWADQIRDCQSRPNGMSVDEWCHTHDISKANYYYRLSQVRKACLDQMQKEPVHQSIVPVCYASNYSSHLRQIYRRINSALPSHCLS